jgi:hypothetical protein
MSLGDLAVTVSAMQAQLVGVETRLRESEAENASMREIIVNLTLENQPTKRRIYGNKTERTQASELQLSLGDLFEAEKQLQKQLDEAVTKAGRDAASPPPDAQPKVKPKGTGPETCWRATFRGSCSKFATRSWRRPPSSSGSTMRSI